MIAFNLKNVLLISIIDIAAISDVDINDNFQFEKCIITNSCYR